MRGQCRLGVALIGILGLAVLPVSTSFGQSVGVFEGPVPRAECGPGSRPETGLQGQVPVGDRESGRSSEGYTCNLELVGHYWTPRTAPSPSATPGARRTENGG